MVPPSNKANRRRMLSLVLLVAVAAVLACGPTTDGGGEPSDSEMATLQALVEEQFATIEGQFSTEEPPTTQAPSGPLSCNSATFDFALTFSDNLYMETIPAEPGDPDIPFLVNPEYVTYTFGGYVLSGTFHEPRISIYPVSEYQAMLPFFGTVLANLQDLLNTQPPEPDGIAFLPLWNAAQLMRAKVNYIPFQNGFGVRFLTQYGQSYWLVNNQDLFYTFQGLTHDGACWVSAIFPISNPALPGDGEPSPDTTVEQMEAYMNTIGPQIDGMADNSFTPTIGGLDMLIASLEVQ